MSKLLASLFSKIFYIEWKLKPTSSNYNMVFDQELDGALDIVRLDNAIKRLIIDYILLSSHLNAQEDQLYWVANYALTGQFDAKLEFIDKKFTDNEIANYITRPFDLETGPLYRFLLIKNGQNKYRFIIVLHHLICSGTSVDFIITELSKYYNDKHYKCNISKEEQQQKIARLSEVLLQQVLARHEEDASFWRTKLVETETVDLSFLKVKEGINNEQNEAFFSLQNITNIGEIRFNLDKTIVLKLKKLRKQYNISPYLFGQSIFALLLHKYTGQERFYLSYPIGIKEGQDFIYGAHVNTNFISYNFSKVTTITDLINYAKAHIKSIKSSNKHHGYMPVSDIMHVANITNLSLAFTQVNLRNKPFTFDKVRACAKSETTVDLINDLVFEQEVTAATVNYVARYRRDKIDEQLLQEFINAYQRLLTQILDDVLTITNHRNLPNIEDYSILSQYQYQQIIYEWNKTEAEYPQDKTIHQLFEEQVERTPDNIAVVYEDKELTYKELNAKANQLAHYLKTNFEIKPDTLIALCLDRSEHMLIAILAVLKAGGAYVPMDPRYPDERIRYILEDTKAQVLLTNEEHLGKTSFQHYMSFLRRQESSKPSYISADLGMDPRQRRDDIGVGYDNLCTCVTIDTLEFQQQLSSYNPTNLKTETTSTDLAYIIYTSGTTGNPKGVMISHQGVINLKYDLSTRYNLGYANSEEVILQFANYVFDASVEQLVLSLLNGYTLLLLPDRLKLEKDQLYNYLQAYKVTHIHATPMFLMQHDFSKITTIKRIISGGDVLSKECYNKIKLDSGHLQIINEYGPTETTITSIVNIIHNDNLLIGKPLSNTKCYVLNKYLTPLPIGAVGELYIGGDGLARGYLNKPELTAEKFIENPFQTEEEKPDKRYEENGKNARLYKTGDLVRWLPDGNLEYIGRNDFQVKIRGYRIELGEIESALLSYAGIKQAVVITREHKGTESDSRMSTYLACYYVADEQLSEATVLQYLQNKLPDYMVPSVLVHLEQLPLTINGKLDRKALPETDCIAKDNYVAPRNELEKQICKIWAEVLGIDESTVGIHDNFFRLGGDSILAIRLVSKLNKELNNNISVSAIFKNNTIAKLTSYLTTFLSDEKIIIQKSNGEATPLSFAQERLWFIERYEEGTNTYNIPLIFELSTEVDIEILESSIKSIVERHEILRSLIKEDEGGNGYQTVINEQEHPFEIRVTRVADKDKLYAELKNEANHVFALSNEYLIRVGVYEVVGCQKKYLGIIVHHIAFDGWSAEIFIKELEEHYRYYCDRVKGKDCKLRLPELEVQYKDFAVWQRGYLSGERLNKQIGYWRDKLAGYELLNLVTDKIRPTKIDYKGDDVYFEIEADVSMRLRELAKELRVSLYSLLLACYYLLLRVYSNQNDIVVGSPIANRHYRQIENLIGFFVNTLALRVEVDTRERAYEFIKRVGSQVIEAQLHQDLPFEKLVEELRVEKDTSRHPIFQVMFAAAGFSGGKSDKATEEVKLFVPYSKERDLYKIAKFDLTVFIDFSEPVLKGNFNYATSLYNEETIRSFVETYKNILGTISELAGNKEKQEQLKVDQIEYLTPETYELIVKEWNKTEADYPQDKTIHQLFEEQVERTPDNIAVVYEDKELRYRELNAKANQLAHYLKTNFEIKPDTLIALCLDRSEHMLIAILAVLKAGGAYVPMDPGYPDERIKYILEDTKAQVVLTNEKNAVIASEAKALARQSRNQHLTEQNWIASSHVAPRNDNILSIDSLEFQQQLSSQPSANTKTDTTSTDLAYVIYTSGTTGNPKGVMIPHKGIVNRIKWMNDTYPLKESDRILQKTPYVFDVSVWELFWANWYGASVVFAKPEGHKDTHYITQLIEKQAITIIHFVPSMLSSFLDYLKSTPVQLNSLRYVFCSGEALQLEQVKACHQLLPKAAIHNLYGPTEASVDILHYDCNKQDLANVYIGRPIYNTTAYVLDSSLSPLPIGAVGELYIGGIGLARGYLHRPDLTVERFVANHFDINGEGKLYKTGDLVRWLPDGNLEYLGRNDFQVKIRGYRIELQEIEAALNSYEGIKQAVVIAREHKQVDSDSSSSKYLVGYYVADSQLLEETILQYLQNKLPDYMVPSTLVHLEQLPLTINGKLDRKALPEPNVIAKDSYVAPRDELEAQICRIWAEVIRIDESKVGIHDNFFRLGGDSILAIRLVSKLNKELNNNISVSAIFKNNTIAKLTNYFTTSATEEKIIIPGSDQKVSPLSFAQERLWFIEKYEEGTNAYNIPLIFLLSKDTDIEILESSIRGTVGRHEVLRSLIREDEEGRGYQLVISEEEQSFEIKRLKVRGQDELYAELKAEVDHIFDLSNEYPIRVCVYEDIGDQKRYLGIVIHHIAFDGWSTDIFIKELEEHYKYYSDKAKGQERSLQLPELEVQYKDFAIWQRNYLSGEQLEKQIGYWKGKLAGYELLHLVTDKVRPSKIDYSGEDVYFEIDASVSKGLRELAKELRVSLYSVLLACYYLMLKSYSNQDDIVVGSPIANRHYSQIENLIGFFVNTLALRVEIDSKENVYEFIKRVGNEVIGAQLHQDLPFEKLVEELEVEKDSSRHPIFQVMFAVQSNEPLASSVKLFEPYKAERDLYKIAKFDLASFIDDSEPVLKGNFNYATSLYSEETIKGFVDTYKNILRTISELAGNKEKQEQLKVDQIEYLTAETYELIVKEWNKTETEYPQNKTIHQLFEEQVERTPDNVAIVYEDKQLTYRELNDRANRLAHYLRQHYSIKPDTLIALCLDRSEHMLIAILAVLKAGSAYVPMDPSYPDERIKYILEDTKAQVVLTNEKTAVILNAIVRLLASEASAIQQLLNHTKDWNASMLAAPRNDNILIIDIPEFEAKLSLQPSTNSKTETTATDLAYVIYTSGTTGNPKGVMIEHKGVVNLSLMHGVEFCLALATNPKNCLWYASYIFDAHVLELYPVILHGHTIHIINDNIRQDLIELSNYIENHNIYIGLIPPALLDTQCLLQLQVLLVGGESTSKQVLDYYYRHNVRPVNLYGPTEVTVYASLHHYLGGSAANIGSPIANTQCYVLDSNLNPLPLGAIGELYIGGIGVARGYLNRPGLTAERFVASPFDISGESKLYKTGDLVRWLPDGNLEYIGRNDTQVKIRGYRIELQEIEALLSSYEGVKQAVVVAQEHKDGEGNGTGNKYIVGYYIADSKLDEEEILDYLRRQLPEYMIPSRLMHLEKLPLTINGKLDRKVLPVPECDHQESYVAPESELEIKICKIWSEILGFPENKIGVTDNFFRLGGNSLSAIRMVSKVNDVFKSNIKIKDIFNANTVDKLTKAILANQGNFIYEKYLIKHSDLEHLYEPFCQSNVQQAYYLGRLGNFELGNVSTHGYIEYKYAALDVEKLEFAFNKLIERHVPLRTVFINGSQQYLREVPYYKIKVHKLHGEHDLIAIRNQLSHKLYDPGVYPLFDVIVSKLDDYYLLHLSFDALLMDGHSIEILFNEWTRIYANPDTILSPLTITYRDYVLQVERIKQSELYRRAEEYWLDQIGDYNFEMRLPLATSPSSVKTPRFARVTKTISLQIWQQLLEKARLVALSPTTILLAIYSKVLCYWSGQDKVCINLTLFNRLPLHPQIHDIIGDFTVLELFNYQDAQNKTIKQQLQETHNRLWSDIEHNLFDGLDLQRLIRVRGEVLPNQIIAPIVLTSVLGNSRKGQKANSVLALDNSYQGIHYAATQTAQVWIDNKAYETEEGFVAEWDYVEQLFDMEVITAIHNSYCELIERLAIAKWDVDGFPNIDTPNKDVKLIEMANSATQEVSIDTLFSRYESVIIEKCLGANTALIDEATDQLFTYKELIEESTLLSKYILNFIKQHQNCSGPLIGILSEKGYNQVVSATAIMKSGHGFLPLNIDWPAGRLQEILAQGESKILLLSKREYSKFHIKETLSSDYQLLVIEEILEQVRKDKTLRAQLAKIDLPIVSAEDIAYVIFTSGSTGKPKGVTISHKGALNTIDAINARFRVTAKDKVLALSELSFDLAIYDIFGLLACGGSIVFPDQDRTKEPAYWVNLVDKYQISIWDTVPQLANLLVDELSAVTQLSSLRLFLLSGDWIPTNLPGKIKAVCPRATVMSLGGATEGSIWSIWYEINKVHADWKSIPYGIAMPNQNMYVLNSNRNHCPIGVIGEIHIGGTGVALNYFGDDEKTSASFIEHKELGRLYKTGDLGKWHKDGYINFEGRVDNQVKLNGYRVELGEIAAKLTKLDGIKEVVVTIQKEKSVNYLVVYLLLTNDSIDNYLESCNLKDTINKQLSMHLPEYMLPHGYMIIESLPLSSNGKLDIKQLPLISIQDNQVYIAPTREEEITICKSYAEVLRISETKVGTLDDFFKLGGNSLLAMQLVSKINRELAIDLKLNDLYKYKTIKGIVQNFCIEGMNVEREIGVI